jgi:hypothetical protein
MTVGTFRIDGNQRYSWMKNQRSLFASLTRPRSLRRKRSQVVESLVAPSRSPLEFDEAFEKLRTECWYRHRKENDAYFPKTRTRRSRSTPRPQRSPKSTPRWSAGSAGVRTKAEERVGAKKPISRCPSWDQTEKRRCIRCESARPSTGEVLTDIARSYNVSHSTISRLS